MRARHALVLGRVSNLPTTWTNVAAGVALSGASLTGWHAVTVCLAISAFYVGGMYLNDAFDRDFDAAHRPERPIPSGAVRASTVFAAGFAMLATGVALVSWVALSPGGGGARAIVASVALGGAIVLYDVHHKNNPLSPLLMGVCRVLVYVVAATCATAEPGMALLWGSGILLAYLIGLTYVAKQETLREFRGAWPLAFLALPFVHVPAFGSAVGIACYAALALWVAYTLSFLVRREGRNVPRAVGQFIAGISLLDAMLVASHGDALLALVCVGAWALTLLLHRVVPGT